MSHSAYAPIQETLSPADEGRVGAFKTPEMLLLFSSEKPSVFYSQVIKETGTQGTFQAVWMQRTDQPPQAVARELLAKESK